MIISGGLNFFEDLMLFDFFLFASNFDSINNTQKSSNQLSLEKFQSKANIIHAYVAG